MRFTQEQVVRLRLRHRGYVIVLITELVFLALLPLATVFPWFLSVMLISMDGILIGLVSRYNRVVRYRQFYYLVGAAAVLMEVVWHLALRLNWGLGQAMTIPHVLIWCVFFLFSVWRMVKTLIREPFVTVAVVMGAASGYSLIGMAGDVMLVATSFLHPAALDTAVLLQGHDPMLLREPLGMLTLSPALMAASFNLLTTVGSGVLSSGSVVAQVLVTAITVSGQLYVAILIALILGRFHTR